MNNDHDNFSERTQNFKEYRDVFLGLMKSIYSEEEYIKKSKKLDIVYYRSSKNIKRFLDKIEYSISDQITYCIKCGASKKDDIKKIREEVESLRGKDSIDLELTIMQFMTNYLDINCKLPLNLYILLVSIYFIFPILNIMMLSTTFNVIFSMIVFFMGIPFFYSLYEINSCLTHDNPLSQDTVFSCFFAILRYSTVYQYNSRKVAFSCKFAKRLIDCINQFLDRKRKKSTM